MIFWVAGTWASCVENAGGGDGGFTKPSVDHAVEITTFVIGMDSILGGLLPIVVLHASVSSQGDSRQCFGFGLRRSSQ